MNKEKLRSFRIDEGLYQKFRGACSFKGITAKDQLETLIRAWTEKAMKEISEKESKRAIAS